MSFAESFEDLKVWQRAMTLRASHPDNDRAGDFLLKNLEATKGRVFITWSGKQSSANHF